MQRQDQRLILDGNPIPRRPHEAQALGVGCRTVNTRSAGHHVVDADRHPDCQRYRRDADGNLSPRRAGEVDVSDRDAGRILRRESPSPWRQLSSRHAAYPLGAAPIG